MEYSRGGSTRCTAVAVRHVARDQVSMGAFAQARVYMLTKGVASTSLSPCWPAYFVVYTVVQNVRTRTS